jgi:TPR repeat protein
MRAILKAGLVTLILPLNLSVPAMAGPLEEIDAANRDGGYTTALRLLRPLAERGDAAAQDRLGLMYEAGYGVPRDYVQAYNWYSKAAEQSGGEDPQEALAVADAQQNVGRFYNIGRGVPQNYVQAYKWYNLSCAHWPAHGEHSLKTFDCTYFRDKLAKKMDARQIADAQKLATDWRPK